MLPQERAPRTAGVIRPTDNLPCIVDIHRMAVLPTEGAQVEDLVQGGGTDAGPDHNGARGGRGLTTPPYRDGK